MAMTDITREAIEEIVESVEKPDGSFDLRDVEKAVAARFGLSAREAKRLVRALDRAMVIGTEGLTRLFNKMAE
jgi:hypothetical protein